MQTKESKESIRWRAGVPSCGCESKYREAITRACGCIGKAERNALSRKASTTKSAARKKTNAPMKLASQNDTWLHVAERVDAFRVVPRLLMLAYYTFFIKAWFWVTEWFMVYDWSTVERPEMALAIAGFPAVILGILTQVLAGLTKSYWSGGRDWSNDESANS